MSKDKAKKENGNLPIFRVIHRFFCKIGLHKWKYERGVINKYYECKWCKRRKVVESDYIYQSIDKDWLNGV
jgi:hypothetical protein